MNAKEKVIQECRTIIQLTVALSAAIERFGEALNELMPPPVAVEHQTVQRGESSL